MATDSRELLFVLGTRPEIIKLAPVIRATEASEKFSTQLIHTGQHYDDELSDVFFETLSVPKPDEWLGIGSGTQGEQTAEALRGIERAITALSPDAVVALGDTNAVLSAALATSKMDPAFAHIEAGIRSFDRSMPEEVNRVLADRVTDLAFAPTETAVEHLSAEGVTTNVWMVGNTVVDACLEHAPIAEKQSAVLERLGISEDRYAVATIHRPRNTDQQDRLVKIIDALDDQSFPVIFPVHPRTQDALAGIDVNSDGALRFIDPLNYLDFLKLLNSARLVSTDSGGIQEEASILEVPCLTVRPNTERPETIKAGVNELVEPKNLSKRIREIYQNPTIRQEMTGHPHLYGNGNSAEKIVSILEEEL
ncbi:UDP-N-acetylglucosamine 2-epimerase (non-hydrolyzing) [Natronomonas halophila]|uniref:non-hydrolyzing UDP-N-acetylglucosamine 2-epimerase n=1 Tax=Natronomonas halophila TaxID=2747817 RepID=UPI0015B64B17|nr:UDP-N-acetylglucosamine 2-epimerase (non-hydrolyzing) [Natronomonas halophila]QLD86831.1 UDP-N-acetylglucosamine 2-epimerase (non-hydrolyzing) [Natronomonas halophila]